MFEAARDNMHAATMGFAVQHDTLFSLVLLAPAAVAYFSSYLIARHPVASLTRLAAKARSDKR